MIKTFEYFNLTNFNKYFNPKNILFKLKKCGLECKYKISKFDKYKTFYSTSPILKELEESELNLVSLYKNNFLTYKVYTMWDPFRIKLEIVDVEKEKEKRKKHFDIDPYGEEYWEENSGNKILDVDSYEDAFNEIIKIEKGLNSFDVR